MNQFIYGLKREYWEHKRLFWAAPVIVSGIFCLMAIMATWSQDGESDWVNLSSLETPPSLESNEGSARSNEITINKADKASDTNEFENDERNSGGLGVTTNPQTESSENETEKSNRGFWFSGVYLAIAWIMASFYALTSLYSDRKDKSILYWKTMPVSELQTVATKFVFAVIGFPLLATVVSWGVALVLLGYAQLVFPPEMLAQDSGGMNFTQLVVWPLVTLITAAFWCAPIFALMLYLSARVRRMPILIFIVVVILTRVIEGVIFRTEYVFTFISDHGVFRLLSKFEELDSVHGFVNHYFFNSFLSMGLGMLIAAVLIWRAAWLRDNRFEIS